MARAFEKWTVLRHGPIVKVTENLWTVEGMLPKMALKRLFTVVRMADGRLLLHNGIALEEDAMREIEAFGEPAILVVPNGYHRLDAKVYKARYPKLRVYCPRGSRKRVEEVVPVDGTYDELPGDSTASLEYAPGVKEAEGVLRVRSADGLTVVFNDLVFNLPHGSGLGGLVFRLIGSTGGPKVTGIGKLFLVKDRSAVKGYLQRLADEPDLRRILVSHGAPITTRPAEVLREVAAAL